MTDAQAAKNVQKLQRTIVDALEDVKAQDLCVFDTEHLSSLFERVIIASGTSNRQTKALSASVRDKVREAGFPKPRIEGEENGEWIIVDCGPAVVHIMQPAIRQYYHLEEIWGEKPVRLKGPAGKAAARAKSAAEPKPTPAAKKASPAPRAKAASAKSPAAKTARAKGGDAASGTSSSPGAKTATRSPAKTSTKTTAKTTAKTPTQKARPTTAAKSRAPRAATAAATPKPTRSKAAPSASPAGRKVRSGA